MPPTCPPGALGSSHFRYILFLFLQIASLPYSFPRSYVSGMPARLLADDAVVALTDHQYEPDI